MVSFYFFPSPGFHQSNRVHDIRIFQNFGNELSFNSSRAQWSIIFFPGPVPCLEFHAQFRTLFSGLSSGRSPLPCRQSTTFPLVHQTLQLSFSASQRILHPALTHPSHLCEFYCLTQPFLSSQCKFCPPVLLSHSTQRVFNVSPPLDLKNCESRYPAILFITPSPVLVVGTQGLNTC